MIVFTIEKDKVKKMEPQLITKKKLKSNYRKTSYFFNVDNQTDKND